jgi:hypothetical protein
MSVILIVRVPDRPSQPKAISIPRVRWKVCASEVGQRVRVGSPAIRADRARALRSLQIGIDSYEVPDGGRRNEVFGDLLVTCRRARGEFTADDAE